MCDKCKNSQPLGSPGLWVENKYVCYDCLYATIKEMARTNIGGIMPYFLQGILEEYFTRKKRHTLNKALIQRVLKKYNHTCVKCSSKENLTIDHIKPVSKGGRDLISNLQVLCKSCNSIKGTK